VTARGFTDPKRAEPSAGDLEGGRAGVMAFRSFSVRLLVFLAIFGAGLVMLM